jgi:hypothetical protein
LVGVDLERRQLAVADDGDEELADHHALHPADRPEPHAGQDFGQRAPQQDLV